MNQSERRTILIRVLLKEHPEYQELRIPADADTQRQLLRGLLNIREPRRIGTDFLQIQDAYLQEETAAKGITNAADLTPMQPGLYLWQGDITRLQCGAIVNAANQVMLGGGGVDGAIHDAAGEELFKACLKVPEVRPGVRCPTGEARITPGFKLPAKFVIHTVGPVYRDGQHGEPEKLAACYRNSLALAAENGCKSIAFPCISTGVYGYPIEDAAKIALREVDEF